MSKIEGAYQKNTLDYILLRDELESNKHKKAPLTTYTHDTALNRLNRLDSRNVRPKTE